MEIFDKYGNRVQSNSPIEFGTSWKGTLAQRLAGMFSEGKALIDEARIKDMKHQIEKRLDERVAQRNADFEIAFARISKSASESMSELEIEKFESQIKVITRATSQMLQQKRDILNSDLPDEDKEELLSDIADAYLSLKGSILNNFTKKSEYAQ